MTLFLGQGALAQGPVVGPSVNLQPHIPGAVRAQSLKEDARNTSEGSRSAPASSVAPNTQQGKDASAEARSAPKIHRAAADGQIGPVSEAIKKDPQAVRLQDSSGYTALHHAAIGGHADIVELLLESGAKIDGIGSRGETPLFLAASTGYVDVVKVLAAAGANVNKMSAEGRTPLHRAAMSGDLAVVQALLEANADPTTKDRSGRTPLDAARYYKAGADNYKLVKLLEKVTPK